MRDGAAGDVEGVVVEFHAATGGGLGSEVTLRGMYAATSSPAFEKLIVNDDVCTHRWDPSQIAELVRDEAPRRQCECACDRHSDHRASIHLACDLTRPLRMEKIAAAIATRVHTDSP